jgi:hypothetical protein
MKHLFLIFGLLIAGMPALTAQSSPMQEVGKALQAGDVAKVASYFDQTVMLNLLGQESLSSKTEAEGLLRTFFKNNPPGKFVQSHSGSSQGANSQYIIGDLTNAKGKFKVYMYFKTSGSKYTLQELRIDQ